MLDSLELACWTQAAKAVRATTAPKQYKMQVFAARRRLAPPPPETPQQRKYRERYGAAWDMLTQADVKNGACVLIVNQDGLLSDALWERFERERSGVRAEFYRPAEDTRSRGSYDAIIVNNAGTEALHNWLTWTCKLQGRDVPLPATEPDGLPRGRTLVTGGRLVAKTLRDNVTAQVLRVAQYAGAQVIQTTDPRAVVFTARRERQEQVSA